MPDPIKLLIAISTLFVASLACNIYPTPAPAEPTATTEPIAAFTAAPAAASGPCLLLTDTSVTAFMRPSQASETFFELSAGFESRILGRTSTGWLGFDPGVAQAANIGPFRLRWVDPMEGVNTTGDCTSVPEVWAAPPGICFTMPMGDTKVYTLPDTASSVIATLHVEDFAAVLGMAADNAWAQVDLGLGNTALTGLGWMESFTLNINGPCSALPTVSS